MMLVYTGWVKLNDTTLCSTRRNWYAVWCNYDVYYCVMTKCTSLIASTLFVTFVFYFYLYVPRIIFRLKELSEKISKQDLRSPSVLRNVVVKEVVIGLSHMAFLLQVCVNNRPNFIDGKFSYLTCSVNMLGS